MATAAVVGPQNVARPLPKAPKEPRPAPTVPVQYPLTGFVRIEDDCRHHSASKLMSSTNATTSAKGSRSSSKGAPPPTKACSRWLYGVLLPGTLQLYARRADYKRRAPPSDEIHMQVRAASANESVFGFDHECVYIRPRDASHVLTVRLHQKKEIGRWVTALYYQSFSSKSPTATSDSTAGTGGAEKYDSGRPAEPGSATSSSSSRSNLSEPHAATARAKRKSVSFLEEPEVRVLPHEPFDPTDLFYSEREYEQFQLRRALEPETDASSSAGADEGKSKKNLSRFIRAFYSKTTAKLRVSHKKSLGQELR
ncbi:hypothetical protein PybrP1_002434 [[Pythium] brassicae (nom. inval.)]|nr:hypothetical protein PybrP1_002434 [[Pythium] brassicae (nom. inval.)]